MCKVTAAITINSRFQSNIDCLRGLACFMLVLYHVIGSTPEYGLKIENGFLRELNDIFIYVRMPLFGLLAGFVYGLRPVSANYHNFVTKKARRLLLPMLSVGTLFAITQWLVPGSNSEENLFLIHILPVGHYWFIESLFLIFLFVALIEKLFFSISNNAKPYWIILLVIMTSIYILGVNIKYFSIEGAFYLLPFFLIGSLFSRFRIDFSLLIKITLTCFCSLIVTHLFLSEFADMLERANRVFISLLVCILLYVFNFKSKTFSAIGRFSYSIFLFHVFFTAATRIVSHKLGIENTSLIIFTSLFTGILGPIIIEFVFNKNKYSDFIFFGNKLSSN